MSGVYINMEMPDRCFSCPLCETDCCGISRGPYIEYRELDVDVAINGRPDWCPLIPVHDHGRLIDADALDDTYEPLGTFSAGWTAAIKAIKELAPTIIPAEEGEG